MSICSKQVGVQLIHNWSPTHSWAISLFEEYVLHKINDYHYYVNVLTNCLIWELVYITLC